METGLPGTGTVAVLAVLALLLLAALAAVLAGFLRTRAARHAAVEEERTRLDLLVRERTAELAREVSQRAAAEEEVRRLNVDLAGRIAEMEALFSVIPIGIGIATDPECRDISLNPEFARMLRLDVNRNASKSGPTADALPFRLLRYDGREIPPDELVMQAAARTGRPVLNDAYRVVFADGTSLDLLGSAAPLFDAESRVRGAVGAFADVTERRRTEEQLQQAQRMQAVGQLAGGVAHDINNSMTTVLGFTEFAAGQLEPDHPVTTDLEQIRAGARRAAEVARQLLAFSRRQQIAPKLWLLDPILAELRGTLQQLAGANIALSMQLEAEHACVRMDRTELEQVLINLTANARDAMPSGGSIAIETRRVDGPQTEAAPGITDPPLGSYAIIHVSDTGTGMSAEVQRRAFEPFFTTKPVGEGTGLGLAIVYGIVQRAGGHVAVASETGKGTTIAVSLPLSVAPAREAAAPADGAVRRASGELILVAEDDANVRSMVQRTLEEHGYRLHLTADGSEAWSAVASGSISPALVVTDIVMPNLSGHELGRLLSEHLPDVPVLYVSGYTGEAIAGEALAPKRTAFLQKPFAPQDLLDRVQRLLDASARHAP